MNNYKKNFLWNSIGSTVVSFTSLLFLIIVTRINGVDDAGIFTFAFTLACMLQVISNYGGRNYQVTEPNSKITDSDFFYSRIITSLLMIIGGIIFVAINRYDLYKTIIIFLLIIFRIVESYQEIFYAVIQKNEQLYKVGISLLIKGVLSIILFLIIDWITKDLILSVISMIISYLLIFIFYDLFNLKQAKFKLSKFDYKKINNILTGAFFVFSLTLLTQYVMNSSKFAIDILLPNESQTIFGILIMPATLMLLCSQFMIQPFLTDFAKLTKKKQTKNLNILTIKLSVALLIIGIVVVILGLLIGIPILNIIYGLNLDDYLWHLIIILIGSILFGLSYILSNVLIAMRKTSMQALIYLIGSAFTLVVSYCLVKNISLDGAAISYALTMLLILILYLLYYIYTMKKFGDSNA